MNPEARAQSTKLVRISKTVILFPLCI